MKEHNAAALEEAEAPVVGKALTGLGVNLLVRNIADSLKFLEQVFDIRPIRADENFALIAYHDTLFMLHPDATYSENPALSLVPEAQARGGGIELRLYHSDPDCSQARAEQSGFSVLRQSQNRPHGLRECYILDNDGYCWVPSRHLSADEEAAL